MKALVIWLIILSYGCSAPVPAPSRSEQGPAAVARPGIRLSGWTFISPGFTPAEQRYIALALQDWRVATDGLVGLTVGDDTNADLTFEPVELQPEYPCELGKTLGLPGPRVTVALDRAYISVVAERPDMPAYFSVLEFTARHEIGHAMGLQHLASGLMAAGASPVDAPVDQLAVDALYALRGDSP